MSSLDPLAYFGFLKGCEPDAWLEEVGDGGCAGGGGCMLSNNDGGGNGGMALDV